MRRFPNRRYLNRKQAANLCRKRGATIERVWPRCGVLARGVPSPVRYKDGERQVQRWLLLQVIEEEVADNVAEALLAFGS